MKVRATQRGQFGCVREVGDVFEVPEYLTGSWFEPVDEPVSERIADDAPRRGRPPKS